MYDGCAGGKSIVSPYFNFSWQKFVEINSFRNVWANNESGQTKEYQPTDTAVLFLTACVVISPGLAERVAGIDNLDEQSFILFWMNKILSCKAIIAC